MNVPTCNILLLSLTLVAVGCSPGFPKNVVYEGEYLRYASTVDTEICEGTFRIQEDYVRALADALAVDLGGPINYALIDPAEIEHYCDTGGTGCYYDGKVYSVLPVHYHELAHAVAFAGGYVGPRAFQEGFAEAFSDGLDGQTFTRRDVEELLNSWTTDGSSYYSMALFVRFLIERHSLEQLLDFLKATEFHESYAAFAPMFAESFDESLNSALADFVDYPSCSSWTNRIAVRECDVAPEPWDGEQWGTKVELDCSHDDVLGPYRSKERDVMWTQRGLVVEEAGDYLLIPGGAADEWGKISLTRCDGACWAPLEISLAPGQEPGFTFLPAGRYHVLFAKDVTEPGTSGLVLVRL